MSIVFVILAAIVVANLLWWRWASRRLRSLRYGRLWNSLVAIFLLGQFAYLSLIFLPRVSHLIQHGIPVGWVATTYIWSLLVLPLSLVCVALFSATRFTFRRIRTISGGLPVTAHPSQNDPQVSRRQFLGATAVSLPPLVTAGLVLRAVPQLSTFRIRSMHLRIAGLPAALDGLRIAHVSDLHVGRYTRPGLIPTMVRAVNELDADLVLFTGDLIDYSLEDLPRGIDALRQFKSRSGLALIEGNHDLIEDADAFDRQVREAGLPLLVDETMTAMVRGQPVQLLGTRWGEATGNRRRANDAAFAQSINRLQALRSSDAFPILLAHHPHAFDAAAAAGFPLVLSGHTHGGQMMATPRIGFGPLFYRYWSGLYQRSSSQLVVNNGIGNWFPLRINAPAEIVALTLHADSH